VGRQYNNDSEVHPRQIYWCHCCSHVFMFNVNLGPERTSGKFFLERWTRMWAKKVTRVERYDNEESYDHCVRWFVVVVVVVSPCFCCWKWPLALLVRGAHIGKINFFRELTPKEAKKVNHPSPNPKMIRWNFWSFEVVRPILDFYPRWDTASEKVCW